MARLSALALALILAPSPAVLASPLPLTIERYQLSSGLTVILHQDHRVPTVAVNLSFPVGSRDEAANRTGFAHLFEHLMFMGTRRVPTGELDRVVESGGGIANAATSEDRTSYLDSGPSHLLETFLFLEADRLDALAAEMSPDKLALQREVVENERRQAYENRPYGRAELALPEALFAPDHPYHHPVIGSVSDLRAATVDELRAFFRARYVPAGAQLVVVGDFDGGDVRRMIERWLGPWSGPPAAPRVAAPPPSLATSRLVVLEDRVVAPQVTLVFPTPAALAPGDAECELLAAVLASGRSSRLYRALVRERALLQSIEVEQHALRLAGYVTVTALGLPGGDAGTIERALDQQLARLSSSPPDAAELGRARATLVTEKLAHLERNAALAEELSEFEDVLGDAAELPRRFVARYDAVTVEGLARTARALLVGRPHVTMQVVPMAERRP